jgi:hypothetical protein
MPARNYTLEQISVNLEINPNNPALEIAKLRQKLAKLRASLLLVDYLLPTTKTPLM